MQEMRDEAAEESKHIISEKIKPLGLLEKVAWLQGANRPASEIHEASSAAKRQGHTWKEIANARGLGSNNDAARVAASIHRRWHKDNGLERNV